MDLAAKRLPAVGSFGALVAGESIKFRLPYLPLLLTEKKKTSSGVPRCRKRCLPRYGEILPSPPPTKKADGGQPSHMASIFRWRLWFEELGMRHWTCHSLGIFSLNSKDHAYIQDYATKTGKSCNFYFLSKPKHWIKKVADCTSGPSEVACLVILEKASLYCQPCGQREGRGNPLYQELKEKSEEFLPLSSSSGSMRE